MLELALQRGYLFQSPLLQNKNKRYSDAKYFAQGKHNSNM